MQCLLADIGDVSGFFLPSLRQALESADVIVRVGEGLHELLHVSEPTPARGRFEAGIEVVRDGDGVAHFSVKFIRNSRAQGERLVHPATKVRGRKRLCCQDRDHYIPFPKRTVGQAIARQSNKRQFQEESRLRWRERTKRMESSGATTKEC